MNMRTLPATAVQHTYKHLKPILFRYDPEQVHDHTVQLAAKVGALPPLRNLTHAMFAYNSPVLAQDICGIHFANPVGLSAGFDKNAQLTQFMPALGFGFMEIGSITGEPCAGNPKPRLTRLPKSQSILVYYGLKNDGCQAIAKRLRGQKFAIPVGINIAKTNNQATCDDAVGIADYAKAMETMSSVGAYYTINISCPNTYGGQPFHDPKRLDALLTRLDAVKSSKPRFLKISPDLTTTQLDSIIAIAGKHRIDGFVCANLTKNRSNRNIKETNIPPHGGFSGAVSKNLANHLIAHLYRRAGRRYVIIGVGGVSNGKDAYAKIRLGASLVELITGMIYNGPQLIGQINRELEELLQRDGYAHISQAIGADIRT